MPNWLITVLLVIVLAWLAFKTVLKGTQLHLAEKQARDVISASSPGDDRTVNPDLLSPSAKMRTDPLRLNGNTDAACVVHVSTSEPATSQECPTLNLGEQEQERSAQHWHWQPGGTEHADDQFGQSSDHDIEQAASDQTDYQQPFHLRMCIPWKVVQFAELTLLWLTFLALQYGKITYSQCSWQFGLLCLAQGVFSLCSTAAFIYQSHALRLSGQAQLEQPLLDDTKQIVSHHDWTTLVLIRCVGTTLLGGAVAGMLGFGGGMILNPLMLEMGIHPLVSSATSSVMVLFSASTATFAFAVNGRLNYQYAAVYGGVCAVASIFGVAFISTSVRRSGKGSLVVFILATIIGTGALLQAIFGGIDVVQDIRTGRHLSFSSWC